MKAFEKIKVNVLKVLGLFFVFGISFRIIHYNFYKEQPTRVQFGMTGIILLSLLALALLRFIKKYRMNKEIAHEVAKNLGQPSQSVNPVTLELMNYISFSIPFVILGLINDLLKSYDGSIIRPLMQCLLSITAGYVFRVFAVVLEQIYLKQSVAKKNDEYQNQIVAKLESSLKQTTLK